MSKRLTTEEFIRRSKEVHGDKYDYSKVDYKNNSTKVTIICPIHGEFQQTPTKHIDRKHGCPFCGGTHKLTTEEFIRRSKEVHGDKFNYSKTNYVDSYTKVTIICPIHGEFQQNPSDHMSGKGCCFCGGTHKLTAEEFIRRAKEINGDKFDYSKVEYKNIDSPVCIICNTCGHEFWQTPNNHTTKNQGCPYCYGNKKLTTEEFIEKAIAVHGNKYDYSKVIYKGNKTKVCIICPIHGEFWQAPDTHINKGYGCPHCKESKGERKIRNWCENNNLIKGEDYIIRYSSDWLNKQHLDIYFPKLRLGVEYDGEQHFKPVERFGGIQAFRKTKKRDRKKNKLCLENNVTLIRIKYTEYKKIENIMNYIFNEYKENLLTEEEHKAYYINFSDDTCRLTEIKEKK